MEDGVVGVEDTLEGTNAAEQRANPRVLDAAPLECPVSDRDVGRQLDLFRRESDTLRDMSPQRGHAVSFLRGLDNTLTVMAKTYR